MLIASDLCMWYLYLVVYAGKEVSYALLRDGGVVMWGEHSATLRPRPFPYVLCLLYSSRFCLNLVSV